MSVSRNVQKLTLAICLLSVFLALASRSAIAQDSDERQARETKRLLKEVGELSPKLKRHLKYLNDEVESAEELAEICEEILEEYEEIKSDRGTKAGRLWCDLFVAEMEVEKVIGEIEDGNPNEALLKEKILQLIDAEIEFEATELELMDDDEEIEDFKRELADRRESRDEELAEVMKEILGEFEGERGSNRDREMEDSLKKELADYKPVQPVKVTAAEIAEAGRKNFKSQVLPALETACYDCHGNGSNEGNLDLEVLLTQTPLVKNRERWDHVIAQIENRTMPPPGNNEVADAERKVLVAWIRDQLENFDFASIRNPGFESAKRLTHLEYNNTIRDLIGIDLRPADRLPKELSTNSGFDNSANSLFLHDGLLERYIGLAEFVVQQAFPVKSRTAQQQRAWDSLFIKVPGNGITETEAARAIFADYLPRVFRSKILKDEINVMVRRFEKYRGQGSDFSTAILKCVQTTLVSPRFLIRVEANQATDHAFKVDDFAIANRISYFLWASMPDERLFQLAHRGQLSDSMTLRAEVERMLRDPKSETLGSSFAGQWLGFEHLGSRIRLDPIDNPWCTDSLMNSMKSETGLFFVSLIRENRPLRELIDPEYTFLNEELAKFYRIENVSGKQMQRVKLNSKNRGGIFAQGSILAVTSFPDRTSPVTRGAWILTNVLGKRPPNPPPNASQLIDEIEERESLSQRQKMELHRRKANCAACHDHIDPLGFALENYDLFGRFRTRAHGKKINAKSKLPDGSEINGLDGLKRYVEEKKLKEVLTQLTRKMLAYALGRQLEYYDEAAVQKIVEAVEEDNWKMKTLVHEIVKSYPFQHKQLQTSGESK